MPISDVLLTETLGRRVGLIKLGDWVRFQQNGRLVIGLVHYINKKCDRFILSLDRYRAD